MPKTSKIVLLWVLPLTFLILFYFYPLGSILQLSFSRAQGSFYSPFQEAIGSPSVRNVLWFTIWQAGLSMLLTLFVGLPGAYLLARYRFPGKSLLRALTSVAFVMPTLVVAAGFTYKDNFQMDEDFLNLHQKAQLLDLAKELKIDIGKAKKNGEIKELILKTWKKGQVPKLLKK